MVDLHSTTGLETLSAFLANKSYIDGYTPSQADVAVFHALKTAPSKNNIHAYRWHKHIASFTEDELKSFGAALSPAGDYASGAFLASGGASKKPKSDEDFDLFGEDDEDDAEAKKKLKEAAGHGKKKDAPVAKSLVVFDVKPWDDETDMTKMEESVRSITMEGLLWGNSKLVPIAFGIKKLQISCVIEDEKVSTDDLQERITEGFQDFVQSVDIQAFNKL